MYHRGWIIEGCDAFNDNLCIQSVSSRSKNADIFSGCEVISASQLSSLALAAPVPSPQQLKRSEGRATAFSTSFETMGSRKEVEGIAKI
jgi:hypothetical protein